MFGIPRFRLRRALCRSPGGDSSELFRPADIFCGLSTGAVVGRRCRATGRHRSFWRRRRNDGARDCHRRCVERRRRFDGGTRLYSHALARLANGVPVVARKRCENIRSIRIESGGQFEGRSLLRYLGFLRKTLTKFDLVAWPRSAFGPERFVARVTSRVRLAASSRSWQAKP